MIRNLCFIQMGHLVGKASNENSLAKITFINLLDRRQHESQ